ncbi:unnamed protein product [Lathyrus oleraceus]|uniref:AIPP2-like SPOC-like domain-containing protein n=1 Tax=Pisum sativum TaxID=3888 RepID=A0A9D4YIK1_PEA|nr:uncharacterized protein LOC127120913 isoform X3 [Pisum sativum]KAI5440246.1 hypothetical protein KIW84_025539 [Pisum sativum]
MRLESGTCNVCSAPCSSCMHLNQAEEFSDENGRSGEAGQSSVNEGNVHSLSSRASENLQHDVSETSNMLSINSSHDSLSENAESRQILMNKYQDTKHSEGHDDNASCISRASDANLVNDSHQRNADRINIPCSSASASHFGVERSGIAPSVEETPSSKDVETDHSSPTIQRQHGQSQNDKSLSDNPSLIHMERDSNSQIPEKISECSIENCNSSLTKESAPIVVSGEKCATNKDKLIDDTSNVSLKVCPKSQADPDNDVCDAKVEDCKCSVHYEHNEKGEELIKSPGKQESQSENESDESDVVEHDVKVCDICGDAGREDLLAICCRCTDGAEHTYCMREMLEKLPEGDWFCEECQDAVEAENKRPDAEEKKIVKTTSMSQVSGKRLSDNIEVAPPAAKRQTLESSKGSPKASSPKKLVPLSRESSFKSSDKLKGKSGLLMPLRNLSGGDDTHPARSSSIGPRGQISKSMLLKSNSSNNLNSKPRVKIVDEIFPPRPKGGSEQTSKNVEPSPRITSRSTLFKSSSLGRSSAIESKVKMLSPKSATTQDLKGSRHLKESGALDRKYLSRNDRHVASSAVSTPKGDQKLTPRGEAIIKPSAVNNRELKINQDGKLNAPSKSMNNISRKSLEPQERTSSSNDEAVQDALPRSRETANQVEKSRESLSNRVRPVVPTALKSPFCQKCEEFGHSIECCTAGTLQESGAELSLTASSISKEEVHKDNKLKAAIQAAALLKRQIYRKKEVSSQIDEISTLGTELNCEVTSQDQVLVSNTLKNSISTEETREQQEVLENSTSDSSKCTSAGDLKKLNSSSTDLCSQLGKSGLVDLNDLKPLLRDLSNKDLAISNVLSKMLAFPEYEYIWQGVFEVHRNEKSPELYTGVQAHLSSSASPKVLEALTKFSSEVSLNEVSRLSTWPSQFHHGGAREDNIALYFFARDVESYERHYRGLLDHMIQNDLALKGVFDGVELLIFPSNQLPESSQRWNMLFFLWGVFRGRRTNHSGSAKKICIPSLNVLPVEENSSTADVMLSEHFLSKGINEKSINSDKVCNALPSFTSIDRSPFTVSRNTDINRQTHLYSQQVSLEKPDGRIDSNTISRVPISCNHLCQSTKSTGSSLEASVLEDERCRESISPEELGTGVSSKMVEAKTDSAISDKTEKTLCWEIPSVSQQERDAAYNISKNELMEKTKYDEDQQRTRRKQKEDCRYIDLEETIENYETCAARNIVKDKASERLNIDEDQQRPKRKQRDGLYIDLEAAVENQGIDAVINITKDKLSEKKEDNEDQQRLKRKAKDRHYIDLEAPLQEDMSSEGVEYHLPNDKEVHHVDLSVVGCPKLLWNEVNEKLEDGEGSRKKLRTSFGGTSGLYSSAGRDSFNDSLTSLGNDLGSCSSVEDKGCEVASNEKIIREDFGTMVRTFFPVDTQNTNGSQLGQNTMSLKGIHVREGVIPNLNLALGEETELPLPHPPPAAPKGMLPPFLVGAVDKKNNRPDSLTEDDVAAASLSLSLSFPSSNKENTQTSSKAELLPDGHSVNPPFLLFGRYTDK